MKVFGVLISAALVVSAKAALDNSWKLDFTKIAKSDFIANYDEPTETLSFYNPSMGMDVTFDGALGVYALVNTTSGAIILNYPRDGAAKLFHPSNSHAIVNAFNQNNLNEGIREISVAIRLNWPRLPLISSTFNMPHILATLFLHTTRIDVFSHKDIDYFNKYKSETAGLKQAFLAFMDENIFFEHDAALMLVGSVMSGKDWTLRVNFIMLLSTILECLNGRFNKDLMLKVQELLYQGKKNGFKKNMFNSLIAAMSIARGLGTTSKIDDALSIAY